MSTVHMVTTTKAVAEVVSDKMPGRGLSVKSLSDSTLIPRTTLARRLAGSSPFTVHELELIAPLLGSTVVSLLTEAEQKRTAA